MTTTALPRPRTAIVVVAAGSGTRLGADRPKAFVGIDEHTVLRHALRGVFAAPYAQVVVVAPAAHVGDALTEIGETAGDRRDVASVVVGGRSRQQSVAAGLSAVWPDVEFVLVHDAARALTPPEVFSRVIAALEDGRDGLDLRLDLPTPSGPTRPTMMPDGISRLTLSSALILP